MVDDEIGTRSNAVAGLGPLVLRLVGAGCLLGTAGIHLDLYLTGYRYIPTIGVLFLAQVAAGLVVSALVLALPSRIVALLGAGFAVATLGGYILSLWVGLFGFNEIRTPAGVAAGALEVAGFVVLAGYALFALEARAGSLEKVTSLGRRALAPLGALALLALVLAVANSSGAASPSIGQRSPARTTAGGAASVKVKIENFTFIPAKFTVSPGERIVVTNKDSVTHTFTAVPGTRPYGNFTSGDIAPGKTVTVIAPRRPGSYAFYCHIHPFMTGTLNVK